MEELKIKFKTAKGVNEYTIKVPTVGQYYDIEVEKQTLSRGMYRSVAGTLTKGMQRSADMIDIQATLTVMCPEFVNDLKTRSFADLGIDDFMEIKKVYIKHFQPWWNNIEQMFKEEDDA